MKFFRHALRRRGVPEAGLLYLVVESWFLLGPPVLRRYGYRMTGPSRKHAFPGCFHPDTRGLRVAAKLPQDAGAPAEKPIIHRCSANIVLP